MWARAWILSIAQLWLATPALGQTPSASSDTSRGTGTNSERDVLAPPKFEIPRPGPCRAELQAAIRLSGTVYDAQHPDRSLAIMGTQNAHKMAVYRCGSRWGSLQILAVRPRAVLLSTETDDPCWLAITRSRSPAPASQKAAPARSKSRRSRAAFTSDELEQSIQRLQPGVYRVDRSLLERAIARAAKIARTTRTRTVQAHGSPVGMALTRIRSGGLLEHLGLKKGDLLKTVNGFQVASIDGMLKARTQLQSAPRLSLALVRDGKQTTIEYRIR